MRTYDHLPIHDAYATLGIHRSEYDAYQRGHFAKLARSGRVTTLVVADETVIAYVSDNRWVADCAACSGGIAVAPDREHWTCWDCGTTFKVEWPTAKDKKAIEAVLIPRIPRLRHCFHTVAIAAARNRIPDTVKSLRSENDRFGLDHHSWTSPRTWVTGELVTASIMNTHIRDNFLETCPALVTTEGDITVATGANALKRIAEGANNEYLRVIAGTVQWSV